MLDMSYVSIVTDNGSRLPARETVVDDDDRRSFARP